MTTGFRPSRDGGVTLRLDAEEASVLRSMASLVLQLVEPPVEQDEFARLVGIGENSEAPDDPVLARLFPDAYTDDTRAAGDFRRYTEDDLRRGKRDNAQAMLSAIPSEGGEVRLDSAEAHAWMRSLNDVRLALGTRLGVDEETYEAFLRGEAQVDDAAAMHVYDWLGGLQETLVQALYATGGPGS